MTRVEKPERRVGALPEEGYGECPSWFLDRDSAQWDKEIEDDWEAGKLDFLVEEAAEAKKGMIRKR